MTLPGQNHNLAEKSERYTPPWIVELARATLGVIDLDPCSCEKAQEVVGASRWIGLPEDGLAVEWAGNVFVNPPGGRGSMQRWLKKCIDHSGDFFFVGFNLQQLPDALRIIWPFRFDPLRVAITSGQRPSYWREHPDEAGHPYGHSFLISSAPFAPCDRIIRLGVL